MHILSGASLRQMLTIPYVVLVLIAATVIGLLSYFAGSRAVDDLSGRVLSETVGRISQAVDKHISGSEAVLETAFPTAVPTAMSVADSLEELRTRFWLATSIHLDPNNYAYYGNRTGQFMGLYRYSETEAELRLRTDGTSPRTIYQYSHIDGELKNPVTEQRIFEPRERPWYKAGQDSDKQTWTSIYIDFKTLQLVSTRARRVNNWEGKFEGVVATDLSLSLLNEFLDDLKLTTNGFAFIVEPDGNLVATSRGPHIRKGAGDDNTRLNAEDSDDPLIAATYQSVRELVNRSLYSNGTMTDSFTAPDGSVVQTGYARLTDDAGLDWIVAVAVPRQDFMHRVSRNVKRTIAMAVTACVLIGLTGIVILNIVSRDLRHLARASKALGEGVIDTQIPVHRRDEIGDLARSFEAMQQRLLTDRLTGIPNREALVRRIEERIIQQRRRGDSQPFAVLFVDLNGFKHINDKLGHEVGDRVLMEFGRRLTSSLRVEDMAARYGGDEFIVVLNQVSNRSDANSARANLEVMLAKPLSTLGELGAVARSITTGASVGLAMCPEDGNDLDTILKHADEDMYRRKRDFDQEAIKVPSVGSASEIVRP